MLTLINSAVGAGVLSFPFALRATGWAAGLACIALVAATEAYTLYVLARFAEHAGAKSYGALVGHASEPAEALTPARGCPALVIPIVIPKNLGHQAAGSDAGRPSCCGAEAAWACSTCGLAGSPNAGASWRFTHDGRHLRVLLWQVGGAPRAPHPAGRALAGGAGSSCRAQTCTAL